MMKGNWFCGEGSFAAPQYLVTRVVGRVVVSGVGHEGSGEGVWGVGRGVGSPRVWQQGWAGGEEAGVA